MPAQILRALVAENTGEGYEKTSAVLREAGIAVCCRVENGRDALQAIGENRFDILVADLVLPVMDGMALAKKIWSMPLRLYPGILLMHLGCLSKADEQTLLEMGGSALCKPWNASDLVASIQSVLVENRRVPCKWRERLGEILDQLDVPDHCGRDFLEEAIYRTCMDRRLAGSLTGRLYPMVGTRFGVTSRRVEQAMRHVIDLAWKSDAIDAQYELFRGTIDAQRGKPTCGEMIAQLADILRLEG